MDYESILSQKSLWKTFFPDNYQQEQVVEDLLQVPDDNEYGFFNECDLEYS